MTVFNGMPYLSDAVDSILGQTYGDFEFVVVDDGSTDSTSAYLASVTDERFHVITRDNGGTAAAANQGLERCRGEFVARMDADDISDPERFEIQVAFLEDHPEIGMVGSFTRSLGETRLGGVVALPTDHDRIVEALRAGRHALSHPSLMIRTDVLRSVGGYWPYRLIDDWDMMLRVAEVTTVANLPEPLLQYRVHRGSLNGKAMDRMRLSIDFARARAEARARGNDELGLDEFLALRRGRGFRGRISDSATNISLSHYRRAVAERNGPSPVKAIPHLVVAGTTRPDLVLRRLARQRRRVT